MGVEKGYYADGEDAYKMDKFFKPSVEKKMMAKITQPIISQYPGAVYPLIEYEELKNKENENEKIEEKKQAKKGGKKHRKKR